MSDVIIDLTQTHTHIDLTHTDTHIDLTAADSDDKVCETKKRSSLKIKRHSSSDRLTRFAGNTEQKCRKLSNCCTVKCKSINTDRQTDSQTDALSVLHQHISPPLQQTVRAMMFEWRLRVKIISPGEKAVKRIYYQYCCVLCFVQHTDTHTHTGFTRARDNEWHWHQLGHVQICTLYNSCTQ